MPNVDVRALAGATATPRPSNEGQHAGQDLDLSRRPFERFFDEHAVCNWKPPLASQKQLFQPPLLNASCPLEQAIVCRLSSLTVLVRHIPAPCNTAVIVVLVEIAHVHLHFFLPFYRPKKSMREESPRRVGGAAMRYLGKRCCSKVIRRRRGVWDSAMQCSLSQCFTLPLAKPSPIECVDVPRSLFQACAFDRSCDIMFALWPMQVMWGHIYVPPQEPRNPAEHVQAVLSSSMPPNFSLEYATQ